MMAASAGTFKMDTVKEVMATGAQLAATISFSGQRTGLKWRSGVLSGVDVFSMENGQIAEVWPYSGDQAAKDVF
jgi:hypothetical protein